MGSASNYPQGNSDSQQASGFAAIDGFQDCAFSGCADDAFARVGREVTHELTLALVSEGVLPPVDHQVGRADPFEMAATLRSGFYMECLRRASTGETWQRGELRELGATSDPALATLERQESSALLRRVSHYISTVVRDNSDSVLGLGPPLPQILPLDRFVVHKRDGTRDHIVLVHLRNPNAAGESWLYHESFPVQFGSNAPAFMQVASSRPGVSQPYAQVNLYSPAAFNQQIDLLRHRGNDLLRDERAQSWFFFELLRYAVAAKAGCAPDAVEIADISVGATRHVPLAHQQNSGTSLLTELRARATASDISRRFIFESVAEVPVNVRANGWTNWSVTLQHCPRSGTAKFCLSK